METKIFTKKWEVKTVSVRVEKHREGEGSSFPQPFYKPYFVAIFTFNTGGVVRTMLDVPRKCYEKLDTMDWTCGEEEDARTKAWEEYEMVLNIFKEGRYHHSRSRDYGVTIYGIDANSPTGVSSIGGCSSIAVVDNLARLFEKLGCLSPTEKC